MAAQRATFDLEKTPDKTTITSIRSALKAIEGVEDVNIDPRKRTITVAYDDEHTSPSTIVAVLDDMHVDAAFSTEA